MSDPYGSLRAGICNGCPTLSFIYDDKRFYCSVKPKKEADVCPCSTCIVKAMCMEDCVHLELFKQNYSIIIGDQNERKRISNSTS